VFDKLQDFFPKHRYGKIAATIRMTWIPVWTCLSIRQVSQFKSRRPEASQHGPEAHTSDMKIACIKSTIWTTFPPVRTHKAFIRKLLVAEVRLFGRGASPSERGSKTGKNFSEILGKLIAQLSVQTAPSFYQARPSFEL
jgi:hypothetical protein